MVDIKLYMENCEETMKRIPDNSIDLILQDPPYLTTDCTFDKQKYDWALLWEEWWRILKPNGVILLFSQMPFTVVICSFALKHYRHRWIWQKDKCGNFLAAKGQPLKYVEEINVFSKQGFLKSNNSENQTICTYNPQFRKGSGRAKGTDSQRFGLSINSIHKRSKQTPLKANPETDGKKRYPQDIIYFPVSDFKQGKRFHPTQKPVDLFRYLICTYSNKGETVFDGYSGSGTTAVACIKEQRNFIGSEISKDYFDKSMERIEREKSQLVLF